MEPLPSNPTPTTPPPTHHPPLMRDTLPVFKPRTVWPIVIGIIACVFGVLGALSGLFNIASPLFMAMVPRATAGQFDPFSAMDAWKSWLIGVGVATTIVGGLLLLGAIMLLNRHTTARPLLLSWAAVKALLVVVGAYVGYQFNQAQMQAMTQSGVVGPSLGGFQSVMPMLGMAGAAIGILWGWVLPGFMLIWFLRPRIAREVAGWRGAING